MNIAPGEADQQFAIHQANTHSNSTSIPFQVTIQGRTLTGRNRWTHSNDGYDSP